MHWDERACKSPLGFLDGRSWRSLAAREFGLTVRFPPVADIQAETPANERGDCRSARSAVRMALP